MPSLAEAMTVAVGHHQAGALEQAEEIYRQVLAAVPDYAEAWHLLGVIYFQRGELAQAVDHIGRAIALDAQAPSFHSNLGNALHAQGRRPEAAAAYRQALRLNPALADPRNNLGLVLHELGQSAEAIEHFRQALAGRPDYAAAHFNLGNVYKEQGRPQEAIVCYRRALELDFRLAQVHNNLGVVLQDQGEFGEAIEHFRRAAQLEPRFAEAHNNLGNALRAEGKPREAADCYDRALKLEPNYAAAHCNQGTALHEIGKRTEAAACYRRALQLNPDFAEAWCNLGNTLHELGQRDEAADCYRKAIALKPEFADAHFNYALNLLTAARFDEGWREYEWRWQRAGFVPRDYPQPRWQGEPLAGRTILLYGEQGLGDVLQFIRYATLVKRRGANVIVESPRALAGLLATCPGVDRVVIGGQEQPQFDVHAPLLSLPGIFGTTLESIPGEVPYLFADAGDVERWRHEFSGVTELKVGIAWQGSPTFGQDRLRSIPLAHYLPLASIPGVRLYSVQMGFGREQLQELGSAAPVIDLGDRLGDFLHTAAIMRNLDLLIGIDSSQSHLAGALGVPVWLALAHAADWRWFTDREDTPWYPRTRLFRQTVLGQWNDVFQRIAVELEQLAQQRG